MEVLNTRVVKVWQINSKNAVTFNTSVTTFGELKNLMMQSFSAELLDYENSRFVEGNSRLSFEHDNTVLPLTVATKEGTYTSELNILILPKKKVKSGASIRTELYEQIKQYKRDFPREASNYFISYATVSTDKLVELVTNFKKRTEKRRSDINQSPLQPKTVVVEEPKMVAKSLLNPLVQSDISQGIDLILKGVKIILSTGIIKTEAKTDFSFDDVEAIYNDLRD